MCIISFFFEHEILLFRWDGIICSGYFHAVNCGHHSGSSEGNHPNGRKFTIENNSDLKEERKKGSLDFFAYFFHQGKKYERFGLEAQFQT